MKLLRRRIAGLLLVSLFALPVPSLADSIFHVTSFSGSGFDSIGVTPFDPVLGTLDSVNVTIIGNMVVTGVALPFLVSAGPTLIPTPYLYQYR